eukprot:166629-Chlamydomonas_euryale.AAC.1
MLCARAGARHVYAVDGSTGAAAMARACVAANGLSSRVTVLAGDAETVSLGEKVDVIVCDGTGPLLLGGGLLRGLAVARNRWLKPGGVVLPDAASLHVTGVDDRDHLVEAKEAWAGVGSAVGVDLGAAMAQQ